MGVCTGEVVNQRNLFLPWSVAIDSGGIVEDSACVIHVCVVPFEGDYAVGEVEIGEWHGCTGIQRDVPSSGRHPGPNIIIKIALVVLIRGAGVGAVDFVDKDPVQADIFSAVKRIP